MYIFHFSYSGLSSCAVAIFVVEEPGWFNLVFEFGYFIFSSLLSFLSESSVYISNKVFCEYILFLQNLYHFDLELN